MPMDEDLESLALALGLSVPLTIVLSVFGGYFLAGRSLQPVRELGARVAALDAEKLETRLPVSRSPDELDALAGQFNELLNRLAGARDVNRRFLRQAAHQIRTQLTLILGEATLSLERQRSPEYRIDTLQRIRLAAEQMWHRVDELFLLAQARAGERVDLTQDVELDGVALECTDLMRSRVTQTGHHLELAEIVPVVVRGNEALLREALLELLENACRYGEPGVPIQVRVTRDGAFAVISVSSAGPPVEPLPATSATGEPADEHGIGLQVVQWIAEQHGGELRMDRSDGLNHVRILVSTRKDP